MWRKLSLQTSNLVKENISITESTLYCLLPRVTLNCSDFALRLLIGATLPANQKLVSKTECVLLSSVFPRLTRSRYKCVIEF